VQEITKEELREYLNYEFGDQAEYAQGGYQQGNQHFYQAEACAGSIPHRAFLCVVSSGQGERRQSPLLHSNEHPVRCATSARSCAGKMLSLTES